VRMTSLVSWVCARRHFDARATMRHPPAGALDTRSWHRLQRLGTIASTRMMEPLRAVAAFSAEARVSPPEWDMLSDTEKGETMERATIYSIASALGISASTVSRAFSRPDMVKSSVREAVLAKAEEVGYQPNRAAR